MAAGPHWTPRLAARSRPPAGPTAWAAWAAAYWLSAAGLAGLAAYRSYEQYSREARSDGLAPERRFLLQVAREAALFRAVEAITLAALVFVVLTVAVTAWKRAQGRRGALGPREERR